MKIEFRKYKYSWFMVFCSAAILAIVAGNIWLLCCGHCVITDYLHIPPIGWALVIANLVAGIVLFLVKRRNNIRPDKDFCGSCRTGLRDTWVYCPNCGDERSVFRGLSNYP
ncbi:MAG: hypothetical protein RQ722_11805 [Desulfuromonadales bacterium]|nr:hypothetical protein [Desulfuromonadales bacterium]